MCLWGTLRPTLLLSSVLQQRIASRNAFPAGSSPASKQAGTGRMWAELGNFSTPPRDQSSLRATTNAEEKDGKEGLPQPWFLSWLLPSAPAWPRGTHGHCLTPLSSAGRSTRACPGHSISTRGLGDSLVFADTHLIQIVAWHLQVSGF